MVRPAETVLPAGYAAQEPWRKDHFIFPMYTSQEYT